MSDVPPSIQSKKVTKGSPNKQKKPRVFSASASRWILTVVGWTFVISISLSFLSNKTLTTLGFIASSAVLLMFILFGILFDMLGLAVATANEKPFHSMATRRVKGASNALKLIRHAEKVASFCNDVVGDISSIISGTTASIIVQRLVVNYGTSELLSSLIISGLVASITVGGKAAGKTIAMRYNTKIVLLAGKVVYHADVLKNKIFKGKSKKRG